MKIAIVGATGLVGRNIIKQCEQLLPKEIEYHLFASSKSAGKSLKINDQDVLVQELNSKNIKEYDIALFSAGGDRSKEFSEYFISREAMLLTILQHLECRMMYHWLCMELMKTR